MLIVLLKKFLKNFLLDEGLVYERINGEEEQS